MDTSAYQIPQPPSSVTLVGLDNFKFSEKNLTNTLEYNPVADNLFGGIIAVLSVLGFVFNIITMWACGLIRKKNCSKVRLASSLFIFHLSISDSIYSLAQLFSGVTLLTAGRRNGIIDTLGVEIMCNITGVLFNITIRSSLWFVTALTFVRYFAVCFPLKMHILVTPHRIYVLAAVVWVIMLLISVVPFTLDVHYRYMKDISICIWSVDMLNLGTTPKLWTHVMLLVLPMVTPGIIVVGLYIQIVWKVIQLKSVHMRIKAVRYIKEETEDQPIPRRRLSKATSVLMSISLTGHRRPLSLIELENWERETANVDEDLINCAVISLSKLGANKETDELTYKQGVVAYYVNRFIVKTAGQATFERIQSNSFVHPASNRESLSEIECPVSLNYYDCPMESSSPPHGKSWQLRKGSGFSLCDDTATLDKKAKKPINKYDKEGLLDTDKTRLPCVVEEVMSNTKSTGKSKDVIPGSHVPTDIKEHEAMVQDAKINFHNAVITCSNGICIEQYPEEEEEEEEEMVLPAVTKKKSPFKVKSFEDSFPQEEVTAITAVEDVVPILHSKPILIPYQMKLPTENKFKVKIPTEMETFPEREVRSPPGQFQKQFTKIQRAFKGKHMSPDNTNKKRIRRLDLRLNIIITSCLFTLFLVTVFCLCYALWWVLSIDILKRYVTGASGVLNVSYTTWCNLIILSFSTILLNATLNPIIYFYYAYRQAMLDVVRLKLKKYKTKKWSFMQ